MTLEYTQSLQYYHTNFPTSGDLAHLTRPYLADIVVL